MPPRLDLMGDIVYVFGYPGTQLMPLKCPHSFTHSFNTMREGGTFGVIMGVGGSLQYASMTCSIFGPESKHIRQRIGHCFAPSMGHEVARPIR